MQRFLNNWESALQAPALASAGQLSVAPADAALLVGLGSGDSYCLTLAETAATGQEVAWEIVTATANAAGTLTVARAQEGTVARDWPAGTKVSVRLTAGALTELAQAGGAQLGDRLTTARALGTEWLALDGSVQAKSAYPALAALLGDRLARLRRSAVVRPDATGTPANICHGNGVHLACFSGTSELVRSTVGGVTWVAAKLADAAGTTMSAYRLAFGAGVFVAVGGSGKIAYSADGLAWTYATSPFSTSVIRCVAFGGGVFVAVGDSGKLATSPDGITWTLRTSQFGTTGVLGVDHGGGRFVIVGGAGKVAYSTDGLTWTLGTSGTGSTLNAVAALPGGFVTYINLLVYTSSDGATWTSNDPGLGAIDGFAAHGGRVILSGTSVVESTDGVTWTTFANPLPGGADVKAFFDDGVLEVVGGNGGMLFARPEGGTWARKTNQLGTDDLKALAYGAGKYVALSASGDLAVSPDGLTWTRIELNVSGVAPTCAIYANGLFVVGSAAGKVMTSADGETWSVATISGLEASAANVVAYGGGRYALIYGNFCASSADGVTWTTAAVSGGGTALIAYGAGRWVLTTSGTTYLTSPDAVIWTSQFDVPASPVGLAFGAGRFVAVNASHVYTSRDGLSWELAGAAPPSPSQLAFGDGAFVLATSHPRVYTSEDGERWDCLSWAYSSTESSVANKRILAANGRVVLGGATGYLATYTPDFDMATHFALPVGDRREFIKAL